MTKTYKRGNWFFITSTWNARPETKEQLARRWALMIRRLQTVHPLFAEWFDWLDDGSVFPVDLDIATLASRMDTLEVTADVRCHKMRARNMADLKHGSKGVKVLAGGGFDVSYLRNWVEFLTDLGFDPDPENIAFETFKAVFLILIDSFEVERAMAYPARFGDSWPKIGDDPPALSPAWMSYVAPSFTHYVVPPDTAVTERRPDGGLLMAATTETFDLANPSHVAVARDIAEGARRFRWDSKPRSLPAR